MALELLEKSLGRLLFRSNFLHPQAHTIFVLDNQFFDVVPVECDHGFPTDVDEEKWETSQTSHTRVRESEYLVQTRGVVTCDVKKKHLNGTVNGGNFGQSEVTLDTFQLFIFPHKFIILA